MSSTSFHKGSPLSLQITESSSINAPLHQYFPSYPVRSKTKIPLLNFSWIGSP